MSYVQLLIYCLEAMNLFEDMSVRQRNTSVRCRLRGCVMELCDWSQHSESEITGCEVGLHCDSKNVYNFNFEYLNKKPTDCDNFRCTISCASLRRETLTLVLRRFFIVFSCLHMVVTVTRGVNDAYADSCSVRLRHFSCINLRYSSHVVDIETSCRKQNFQNVCITLRHI